MNNIVRPRVTQEIINAAAAASHATHNNFPANDISRTYTHPMDGYELAKELETYRNWDVDFDVCETLNEFQDYVEAKHLTICKEWAKTIDPPFPIGTRIKEGVIDRVYEHAPATYAVQVDGEKENQKLLVKFELAELDT
jgi:hypothetical protein